MYFNQAPVRAAINGRLLVIDGIENAERNVLPSLNNLLENREMSLEDGSFLTGKTFSARSSCATSRLLAVHPDFQVVALGVPVPPYPGRSLDPPLRSRFQCRYVDDLSSHSIMSSLDSSFPVNMGKAEKLIQFYETIMSLRHYAISENMSLSGLPGISTDFFVKSLKLMESFPKLSEVSVISRTIPVLSHLNYLLPTKFEYTVSEAVASLRRSNTSDFSKGLASSDQYKLISLKTGEENFAQAHFATLLNEDVPSKSLVEMPCGPHLLESINTVEGQLLSHQYKALCDMLMDHSCGLHIALLGPKGSGKHTDILSFIWCHTYIFEHRKNSFSSYLCLSFRVQRSYISSLQ